MPVRIEGAVEIHGQTTSRISDIATPSAHRGGERVNTRDVERRRQRPAGSRPVEFSHQSAIHLAGGCEFLVELLDAGGEVEHELLKVGLERVGCGGRAQATALECLLASISESLSSRSWMRWDSRRLSAWRLAFSGEHGAVADAVAAGEGLLIASAAAARTAA